MLSAVIVLLANIESDLRRVLALMDIGTKGYFVLFGLLFSCGLGVPIPEDIPLLVAGALVGSGHMSLVPAAILAWLGIVGGDCVLYYLGHHFGLNITKLPLIGKHVTLTRIKRAELLFQRYGTWVVAIGRLFAGIRGAMVVAAGTIRFSFIKFLVADGLAAVVSGGMFIFLGFKFGQNLRMVAHAIHRNAAFLLVILVIATIAFVFWKIRAAKKHALELKAEQVREHIGGLDPRIEDSAVQMEAD
jgi:membrane protein DedA with SNARE-associated domain